MNKYLSWFIYSVCFGLIPLLIKLIINMFTSQSIDFYSLSSEVLCFDVVLILSCLKDIDNIQNKNTKHLIIFAVIIALILAILSVMVLNLYEQIPAIQEKFDILIIKISDIIATVIAILISLIMTITNPIKKEVVTC